MSNADCRHAGHTNRRNAGSGQSVLTVHLAHTKQKTCRQSSQLQCKPPFGTQVAEDLYQGLLRFFDEEPHLQRRPLFITGESYAGKYVPSVGEWNLFPRLTTLIADGVCQGACHDAQSFCTCRPLCLADAAAGRRFSSSQPTPALQQEGSVYQQCAAPAQLSVGGPCNRRRAYRPTDSGASLLMRSYCCTMHAIASEYATSITTWCGT